MVDCRTQRVVVKGKEAAADPLRVVERLQRKSGRKVELLTPIPPEPEKAEEKKEEEKETPKPVEDKKEEVSGWGLLLPPFSSLCSSLGYWVLFSLLQPQLMETVLKVRMHCDACSQEMKKRILKMKGT